MKSTRIQFVNARNCALVFAAFVVAAGSLHAHNLDTRSTSIHYAADYIKLMNQRAVAHEPLNQIGDEFWVVIKTTPGPGTTTGVGGYQTFYVPPWVQILDAAYVLPDPTAVHGFAAVPMKGQSPIAIGDGSVGAKSTPELIGLTLPGTNGLGQAYAPLTAEGLHRGTIAGVYADTGIFYSTDPRTEFNSYGAAAIGGAEPLINNSGDTAGEWDEEKVDDPTVLGTMTLWDSYQLRAFGNKAGPIIDYPDQRGNAPWGLANAVAGPQSGYAWEFDYATYTNTVGTPLEKVQAAIQIGPWKRIQYPGGQISLDQPGLASTEIGYTAIDASTLGYDLSPANPLPVDTTAVRFAIGQLELGRPEYSAVKMKILSDPGASCVAMYGDAFGGDAGGIDNGKDHIWRYFDPTVLKLSPCTLLQKSVSKSLVAPGELFFYTIVFANNGTAPFSNITLTDTLPDGISYVSATPPPASSSSPVYTWDLGTVLPGSMVVITNWARADKIGTHFNNVTARSGTEIIGSANQSVMVAYRSQLQKKKTVTPSNVAAGATVDYTITVNNDGTGANGTPLIVRDYLPPGFTFESFLSATLNGSNLKSPPLVIDTADPAFATFTVRQGIKAGNELILKFRARVDADAEIGTHFNAVELLYEGKRQPPIPEAPVIVGGGQIGDTVYRDWDGDGTQDAEEEEGIPNVPVRLYTDANSNGLYDAGTDTLVDTTATDADGNYLFDGVSEGVYVVVVDTTSSGVSGYTVTQDPDGPLDGQAGVMLGFGVYDLDQDFGFEPVGTGIIGDLVFEDADNNGVFDTGETGIDAVSVSLYQDTDGDGAIDPVADYRVATTITAVNGTYSFTGLAEGLDYLVLVHETDPDLTSHFSPNSFNSTTGTLHPVTDLSGTVTDADFGFLNRVPGTIGDLVFEDANTNGVYDAGEVGIDDVTVTLYRDVNANGGVDASDYVYATRVTDAGGNYTFTNLPPNANYIVTADAADPDLDAYFGEYDYLPKTGATHDVGTLAVAQNYDTADFGFLRIEPSRIGDTVFEDANNNGVFDTGDTGIDAVSVSLYQDTNGDGAIDPVDDALLATTTTDTNGNYSFIKQAEGLDYLVLVHETDPDLASYFAPNSFNSTTGILQPVTNFSGTYNDADFGFLEIVPGTIGDTVFEDANNNGVFDDGDVGIDDVTVTLYRDVNADGVVDASDYVYATQVTDASGVYTFAALPPNAGYIAVVDTADPDLDAYFGVDEYLLTTDATHNAGTLAIAQNYDTADFGFLRVEPGSIGDQVFIDANADGLYNTGDGDEPLAYVPLDLYVDSNNNGVLDDGDTLLASTATAADGTYAFTNIFTGNYFVDIDADDAHIPSGYVTSVSDPYFVHLGVSDDHTEIDFPFLPLITKSVDLATAAPDDTLTYSIKPFYPGTNLLSNVKVTDAVPDGTTYVGSSANAGGVESAGTVKWSLGSSIAPVPGTTPGIAYDSVSTSIVTTVDTYINIEKLDENQGSSTDLILRDKSDNLKQKHGLIAFDVASIPSNAIISRATMKVTEEANNDSGRIDVYEVLTGWAESTATWNDPNGTAAGDWQSGTFGSGDLGATALGSFTTVGTDGKVYEVDITAAVSNWVATGTNYGIALYSANDTDKDLKFYSSDSGTAAYHPAVEITYYIPVPHSTGGTTVLDPTGDTWLEQKNPLRNYGIDTELKVKNQATDNKIGLVQFGPDMLPPGATLVSAFVEWNVTADSVDPIHLYPMTTAWEEGTEDAAEGGTGASWNTTDGTTSWAGGTFSSSDYTTSVGSFTAAAAQVYSNDITSLVSDWLDGTTTNNGLALVMTGGSGDEGKMNSLEVGTGYPRLVLSWTNEVSVGTSTEMIAEPALVCAPDTITVTMSLLPGGNTVSNVAPTNALTATATGGGSPLFTKLTGPTPSTFDSVDTNGVNVTYTYGVSGITTTGSVTFSGGATGEFDGDAFNFAEATSQSILLTPPLTFQATVDNPSTLGVIENTATLQDSGTIPSTESEPALTAIGASIGDFVWLDADGDGVQDAGEQGLSGVDVQLYDSTGTNLLATATTDLMGKYHFYGLAAGTYTVVLSDAGAAGDTSPSTPTVQSVTLTASEQFVDADFGLKPALETSPASIGDTVWLDANQDGVRDAGEPGSAGVGVNLYLDVNGNGSLDPGDTLVQTATTDASGNYTFDGLYPASYLVSADLTAAGLELVSGTNPHAVALSSGQTYLDADFGVNGTGSIGDQVFVDADESGTYNAGDTPIPVVTVGLYADENGNGIIDAEDDLLAATETAGNGTYSFGALVAGDYLVLVDEADGNIPPNHTTSVSPIAVSLSSGQTYTAADFPFVSDFTPVSGGGASLQKSVDLTSASAGSTLTYTLSPFYDGTNLLSDVIVADAIPEGTTYVPASANAGGGINGSGEVVWNLGSNAVGVPGVASGLGTASAELTWNTFLGSTTYDYTHDLVVDSSGNTYVVGHGNPGWGSPVRNFTSGDDGYVAKLDSDGNLLWNTFLGGGSSDRVNGVALDSSGNVYVVGDSGTTWGSPLQAYTGGIEAFVAKLNGSTGSLTWNTFLGHATGPDNGNSIAVDGSGNVYVAGYSALTWGSPVQSHQGFSDGFAAKLTSSGSLTWSTFLGGGSSDVATGIAVDGGGNVYVAGYSSGTWGSPDRSYSGGTDAFAAKLTSSGSLTWNTFLGGSGTDRSTAVAVDGSGNVYVAGDSYGTWGSPADAFSGTSDGFAAKLTSGGILTWNNFVGGSGADYVTDLALDGDANIYLSGYSSADWGSPLLDFSGGSEAFAAMLSNSGTRNWNAFLGSSSSDNGQAVAVVSNSRVYVAGGSSAPGWGSPVRPFSVGTQTYFTDSFVAELDIAWLAGPSLTNVMDVSRTLVTSGATVTVVMELTAGETYTNVVPANTLDVVTTGGTTATKLTGPTPAITDVDTNAVCITYTYLVEAGATTGAVTFAGSASSAEFAFEDATSQSVLVTPPLTFQVTVDADVSVETITNQAVISSMTNLPPTYSQEVVTYLSGTIGDFVWVDLDGDGEQDAGEPGLGLVTVFIDVNGNGILDDGERSEVTDGAGAYHVLNLTNDTYAVRVDLSTIPAGYSATTQRELTRTLSAVSRQVDDADFGFQPPPDNPSSIAGSVWVDSDEDGVIDGTEDGITNVTVKLYYDVDNNGVITSADLQVSEAKTGADGNYSFPGLHPHDYLVEVDTNSLPAAGLELVSGIDPADVTLGVGENVTGIDFGYNYTGSIGDTVWWDNDADGIQDPGEEPVSHAFVMLYIDVNGNGVLDPNFGDYQVGYAITDTNGLYLIENLPPGGYLVDVYEDSMITGGIRDIVPTTLEVVYHDLAAGESFLDADFGYYQGARVQGNVFWDDNRNAYFEDEETGLANVAITLTGTDLSGTPVERTATTDGAGHYYFIVPEGDYAVTYNQADVLVNNPSFNDVTTPLTYGFHAYPGEDGDRISYDFGVDHSGRMGDTVFADVNGTPGQQAGEAGLQNVTVQLYANPDNSPALNDDEILMELTLTDAQGKYDFIGLADGYYLVQVDTDTLPAVYETVPTTDPDTTLDSQGTATIVGGGSVLTVDFGYPLTPLSYGVSGTIYDDNGAGGIEANGIQDGAEPGLTNVQVTIQVDADTNGVYETSYVVFTDASGSYELLGIPEGSDLLLTVDESSLPSAAYVQTGDPDNGTLSKVWSIADIQANTPDLDFGYRAQYASIAGAVVDGDGNGMADVGEDPLTNVTVTLLYAGVDGIFGTDDDAETNTVTDIDGAYSFTGVVPGNYRITETDPDGYVSLADADGGNLNSIDVQGLLPGQDVTGRDFEDTLPDRYLGDTVWHDLNGDGVQDPGEPGLAGVAVRLYVKGPDGIPGTADDVLENTAVTDENGEYLLEDLAPGTYLVDVVADSLPAGYANQPTVDLDGISTPHLAVVTLDASEGRLDADFGYRGISVIGDRIWLDENGDGVQNAGEAGIANVTVELLDSETNVVAATVTDANGTYLFADVYPGSYTVRVDESTMPAGLAANPTADEDGAGTPHSSAVVLQGDVYLTADFGYNWAPPSDTAGGTGTGAIGDRLWIDADGDGVQDANEAGLGGIDVVLYSDPDRNGVYSTVLGSTVTDAAGSYIFDGIAAGAYVVEVNGGTAPAGYTPTGDPDDGTPDNRTDPIVLAPGDVYVNADFGYAPASGSAISGTVYFDADADSDLNSADAGIPGVTVALLDSNAVVIATALTDAGGAYTFPCLPAGDYTVWVNDTGNLIGRLAQTEDADAVADDRAPLTVDGSADVTDLDFGYTPVGHSSGQGLIGDTIYLDRNGDGWTAGEGLEGVTVQLVDTNGTAVAAAVTDGNGQYRFGGLADGIYTVRVETGSLPAGLTSSADPDGGFDSESAVTISGGTIDLGQDFGYTAAAPNAIEGTVWNDRDADGTLDAAESNGYASVTVTLLDSSGSVLAVTTTDAGGNYSFSGLPDGTYTVDVTDEANVLNGTWHSSGTAAADGQSQSDSTTVAISGGNTFPADFGYYSEGAALGNRVWNDVNGNGVQDSGESGMSGVSVYLEIRYATATGTVVTVSDAGGFYRFGNLLLDEDTDGTGAGEPLFILSVGHVANFNHTFYDKAGVADSEDADCSIGVVALPIQGQNDVAFGATPADDAAGGWYDFGFTSLPTLSVISAVRSELVDGTAVISWDVEIELDTAGYWLERRTGDAWVRVNTTLIDPDWFAVGPRTYEQADPDAPIGTVQRYQIVELDNQGRLLAYGPYDLALDGGEVSFATWAAAIEWGRADSGPSADPDGDGLTSFQEYLAGTDPLSANSVLRISRVCPVRDGLEVSWSSETGKVYTVQMSTSLAEPFWPVATGLPATPPQNSWVVPVDASSVRNAFFRVILAQ